MAKSITLDRLGKEIVGNGIAKKVGHGTGSLGILAGRYVPALNGELGGAPDAEIFSVDIVAGSKLNVVHLSTASMGAAIIYAVSNGADVITISAGGAPSRYWAQAVNGAYEAGVPIFAAAGDFFTLPFLGVPVSPYRTVYPAAFPRVMSVTGATSKHRSYGLRGTWIALLPWVWQKASMRGSYGPLSQRHKAIAGYAPNVPWAKLGTDRVDADGAGTSSTTPQAAAAAALWIAYNNAKLPSRQSANAWRRAEAVYHALRVSAAHSDFGEAYDARYFGSGLLRAADALRYGPASDLAKQRDAKADLSWLTVLLPQSPVRIAASQSGTGAKQFWDETYALEMAQIISRSQRLQALSNAYLESGGEKDLLRLRKAIAADRNCSPSLRERLGSRQS